MQKEGENGILFVRINEGNKHGWKRGSYICMCSYVCVVGSLVLAMKFQKTGWPGYEFPVMSCLKYANPSMNVKQLLMHH